MPKLNAAAALVVDDSHPVTREWNSLNSRVFDAIASGSLVLTNCEGGAAELFPGLLPTFSSADELEALTQEYLDAPEKREALAADLRAEVLKKHSYRHRAETVRNVLGGFVRSVQRFAIKIGVPRHEEKEAWGDWHFALALQRALRKAGHEARIDILPDWYGPLSVSDDVVIVLRGLSAFEPTPGKINLLWMISHPDKVAVDELNKFDHVFVASLPYADVLRRWLGDKVSPLLQCTDPLLFNRDVAAPDDVPDILFVGNSRGVRRPIIDHAVRAGIKVGVYGRDWETIIPKEHVSGSHVPNAELGGYYRSASIVLNDHWSDMRREGFLSNRLYDAGACGAAIISDDVEGFADVFGNSVVTYRDPEQLRAEVERLLLDVDGRKEMGERLRRIVLDAHTFDHRVQAILAVTRAYV
jgi:spore maturation protein CgeB